MQKFRDFITESSSLTKLGVSSNQLQTLNKRKVAIKHDSSWEMVKSKTEIKNRFEGRDQTAISIDKDGTLFIIYNLGYDFFFRKILQDGTEEDIEKFNSISKAMAKFGTGDYYMATDSIMVKKDKSEDNTDLAMKISDLVNKEAEKLFNDKKIEIAERVKGLIASGDFASAYSSIKPLISENNSGVKNYGILDLLSGYTPKKFYQLLAQEINGETKISSFGYYDTIDYLLKTATTQEIRAAGAQLLKNIKEKLSTL